MLIEKLEREKVLDVLYNGDREKVQLYRKGNCSGKVHSVCVGVSLLSR